MQDGKALQCGTSHNLGQNFAKAFDIKFLGRNQQQEYAWTTSWGVSTRLIGAMIMAHSDDEGVVLRRASPHSRRRRSDLQRRCRKAEGARVHRQAHHRPRGRSRSDRGRQAPIPRRDRQFLLRPITHQRIIVDWRDARPGDKQYHWEQRGVPFRFEVGPRDVDADAFVLKRRLDRAKETIPAADVSPQWLRAKLEAVHQAMFDKARQFRDENISPAITYAEMKSILATQGGFVRCFFHPDRAAEARIKEETKATVRVIPFEQSGQTGKCIYSGQETTTEVLFAQAY